jgi:uncharacterized ion transporter superfamily protein YfcC
MTNGAPPRRRLKLPHTLVLIYLLLLGVYILGLVLPAGEFRRVEKEVQKQTRLITVAGTYHAAPRPRLGPHWLLTAPVKGFQDGALIIFVVFIFGGVFAILDRTGALAGGIRRMSFWFLARPRLRRAMIPVLMVIFSSAGAIYGMSEEAIPFTLIFIPLAISMGYDSIVGVAIPFIGSAIGFSAAFFNPFTVGIAQGFADLPLYSGLGYRLLLWVLGTTVATIFVMIYAERVRRDPQRSPVFALDRERGEAGAGSVPVAGGEASGWGWRQRAVLLTLGAGMILLVVGILAWGWYMEEIAALFLAIGIVSGMICRLSFSEQAESFIRGARDMMNVALIIALGRAVLILLQQAGVLDTILYYAASVITRVPTVVTAQAMLLVQATINFFVHSGTAQAALTMPLMAPLSDLVGVTRQTTVLAFQLCEVINPILPTSAVTMGVLGVARIPWEKWARWFLPLMLILLGFSLLALIPPVLLHWGPF